MSYDRLAPTISSKAKKLFGSGNMGQNNWGGGAVPFSDGLDTRPCKILDPRLILVNNNERKTNGIPARHRSRVFRCGRGGAVCWRRAGTGTCQRQRAAAAAVWWWWHRGLGPRLGLESFCGRSTAAVSVLYRLSLLFAS